MYPQSEPLETYLPGDLRVGDESREPISPRIHRRPLQVTVIVTRRGSRGQGTRVGRRVSVLAVAALVAQSSAGAQGGEPGTLPGHQ